MTGKQERFIDEYLKDYNATQAAIRAGYSKKTAKQIGEENLSKPDIKTEIDKRKAEIAKRNGVTQDEIIQELKRIGFAKITDFVSYRTEQTKIGVDKDTGEPIIDYDTVIDMKDSDTIDGSVVSEIGRGKDGSFKFKLHNKVAALEKLGKHIGMFSDKLDVTGNINLIINHRWTPSDVNNEGNECDDEE